MANVLRNRIGGSSGAALAGFGAAVTRRGLEEFAEAENEQYVDDMSDYGLEVTKHIGRRNVLRDQYRSDPKGLAGAIEKENEDFVKRLEGLGKTDKSVEAIDKRAAANLASEEVSDDAWVRTQTYNNVLADDRVRENYYAQNREFANLIDANQHYQNYEDGLSDSIVEGGLQLTEDQVAARSRNVKTKTYSNLILQHPEFSTDIGESPDYYANNPDQYLIDAGLIKKGEKFFLPDEKADLKSSYATAKNTAERQIQKERDLRARTIEKDIYHLQSSGEPGDSQKGLKLLNSPEARELLSTSVQRTLNNGFNNTKTYTPEEKATAHTEGIEAMVAFRAGRIKQADAKKIIDKLRSEGKIDDVDGQAWTEELLGFKKSPAAASGTATAMDLGVESIKKMKKLKSDLIKAGGQKYTTGEVIEGENIPREIVKSDAYYNQQIIDAEAYFNINPDKTPTEVNKYFELLNAPAKDELAKDIVTRKWYEGLGSGAAPLFGGPGRGRLEPQVENPYKGDYPDAFQVDGKWYVMKDGKRYRIKD